MKYRSKSDMIGLILEAANGGATKTKIMYSALLSFEQLEQCRWLQRRFELLNCSYPKTAEIDSMRALIFD